MKRGREGSLIPGGKVHNEVRAGVRGEQVVAIHPKAFGAYNDCSIRRPNANKISRRRTGVKRARGWPRTCCPDPLCRRMRAR